MSSRGAFLPHLLRKLDHKSLWDWERYREWLSAGDAPADCLEDLRTNDNRLSVWLLAEPSDSGRAIAALTAQRKLVKEMDYALIPLDKFDAQDLKLEVVEGQTPDDGVNKWHRDITKLSGKGLTRLAMLVSDHLEERCPKTRVAGLVAESIRAEFLRESDITPEMLAFLKGKRFL